MRILISLALIPGIILLGIANFFWLHGDPATRKEPTKKYFKLSMIFFGIAALLKILEMTFN